MIEQHIYPIRGHKVVLSQDASIDAIRRLMKAPDPLRREIGWHYLGARMLLKGHARL